MDEESEFNNDGLDIPSLGVEVVLVLFSFEVVPFFTALDDAVGEEAILILDEGGDTFGGHIGTSGLMSVDAVSEFSFLVGDINHRFAVSEVAQLDGDEEGDVLGDVGDLAEGLHVFCFFI